MQMVLLLFSLVGAAFGLEVRQSRSDIIVKPGGKVHIFCTHEKTNFWVMLWYRQPPADAALKLIGHVYTSSIKMEDEDDRDVQIVGDLSGNTGKNSSLVIHAVDPKHAAVYYCAAREGGYTGNEAYFGKGTKLTVLEDGINITSPTVRILQPSCENKEMKNRTLVCMATGFYPDHVTVTWESNIDKIGNVSTDAAAKKEEDGYYNITSRLTVPGEVWKKKDTKFKCIVSFFNGTNTINKTDVFTIKPPFIPGMTRGKYVKITQNAKLSYTVLIVKSCLYAALVSLLVWKLQGKREKQTK